MINGQPAAAGIGFSVFHESGRIESVRTAHAEIEWRKGRFDITPKLGLNALGFILIMPEQFNP